MIFLTNIDLKGNELQNAIVQPLAAPPSNPKLGQIYTDSVSQKIKWYNGTEWKTIGVVVEESETNGNIKVDGVEMSVYELPVATTETLGGVKVGAGLTATGDGTLNVDVVDNVTTADTTKPLSANQGKTLKDTIDGILEQIGEMGGGDMMKAVYDTDGDGVVDDAEKLGGQLPEYYAKASDIPVALSELTNDTNFIDNTVANLVNYYTKTEVGGLIGAIATIQISVVDQLPASGQSNIIYLVPKAGGSGQNVKDEYLWTGSAFEKIGDTEIDLSNYLTKTGDASNTTVVFTQAGERVNVASGESLAILMGKVAKYFADLKTVAFSGSYNDLTDKPVTIQKGTFDISTEQTTNSATYEGTQILNVVVIDSVTKEVVMADVSINGMTVTVEVSVTPANPLNVIVSYM